MKQLCIRFVFCLFLEDSDIHINPTCHAYMKLDFITMHGSVWPHITTDDLIQEAGAI